jgi:signal transduction histidine kinase
MSTEVSAASSRQLADSDLARRSRLAALFYLILYGVFILATPYRHDYPVISFAISVVILLSSVVRTWLVLKFDRYYTRSPEGWLRGFYIATLLLAATWGLFCAHAVYHYKLDWTAMLALLSTAGISAGAITTLSIRRNLIMLYLGLLLLPATAVAASLRTTESFAITAMFLTFCAFLFGVAKRIHQEYWRALDNAQLLKRRARELEASNDELESYSYSIAHDLRTPLRSIIGFSQILKQDLHDRLTASQSGDLDRVVSAGKHMADLIDHILDLSRITRRHLQSRDVDLSELVRAHANALMQAEPERSVSFRIQPGVHARGDIHLLTIALQNLVENAWKFTRGNEHAEVIFKTDSNNGETVYSLTDNGVGFDMSHAERLFRPFDRLHNHSEFPGTGIGLATVKRIVLRHGGRIWAEAAPGAGACFRFTLG